MVKKQLYYTSGFTLLEVLISLAIFTMIGLTTVKQISLIKSTKEKSFIELDLYSMSRAFISILRFDLSQAFHVRYDDLGAVNKKKLLNAEDVAHTMFDGRKDQMIFTSLSHRNYYLNRREAKGTEISYFLQNPDKNKYPEFAKRESTLIDEDLYEGGVIYTLIEGVKNLEFLYWDEKVGEWIDDWNSDGDQRDRFPLSVKVKIAISRETEKREDFVFETVVKINFPNNQKFLVEF